MILLNSPSVGASLLQRNLAVPDTVVAKKWFVLMSLYYVCFSSDGVATCLDFEFSMIIVKLGKRQHLK